MEYRTKVGRNVTYYLLLPHVVALTDGSAYDGIQCRYHRAAVLPCKGKNRLEWQVDVNNTLPGGSAAEQFFRNMEYVVLLRNELALGLSGCASLKDVLVAWESVNAVSSKLVVIIGMTIERQDSMEESADRPHVGKPVEHMERKAPLAVGHIEHETIGLFRAKGPRTFIFPYHCDLLHLGGLHEESPPHYYWACPKIPVYPQSTQHCSPQFIGMHALSQLAFRLYHCSPLTGTAPVKCFIKKKQFLHLVSSQVLFHLRQAVDGGVGVLLYSNDSFWACSNSFLAIVMLPGW